MFQQRDSREQATVRLFDKDKTRQEEVVKLESMDRTLKLVPDFKAQKDDAWYGRVTFVKTMLTRQVDLGSTGGLTRACTRSCRT
jgi:hypothetical protein